MITINTISEKYFSLNGINFAKIYQPLKQGSENIAIYNIFDSSQQIISSSKYSDFVIDGAAFASVEDVVSKILEVVYSSGISSLLIQVESKTDKGGYSGTSQDLKDEIDSKAFEGLVTYQTKAALEAVDPVPSEGTPAKVANDSTSLNNGYYSVVSGAWVKDVGLFEQVQDEIFEDSIEKDSLKAVRGGDIYDALTTELSEFSILSDSSVVVANGLTFDLEDGEFDVVLGRSYPWLTVETNKYEFILDAQSKYIVIAKGEDSVLTVTLDNTINSCRIYRFTDSDGLAAVVTDLPNNLFTYGNTITAYSEEDVVKIYENGILKFTYDYGSSSESEFSNPVFGNVFVATGVQLTGVKVEVKEGFNNFQKIDERLDLIEEDIVLLKDAIYSTEDTVLLNGQNMADVGDSILDQNGMQPILITRLGIASNQSLSVSGKKIISGDADSIVNQIQNITNSPKLILIGGGTNDFGNNSPLGVYDSVDTTEFYGALNFILQYAIDNYPEAKILKLGLPFGDWQTVNGFAKGQVNNLGLTRYDYMFAERDACRRKGVVYVNQLELLNWNIYNIDEKTSDRIHPNSQGSVERAKLVSEFINLIF